jgi:hypothetical protein
VQSFFLVRPFEAHFNKSWITFLSCWDVKK